MTVVVARFETESKLLQALPCLRTVGTGETHTPKALESEGSPSVLPLVVLIAGVVGTLVSFCMQSYASIVSYPIDIGGRPQFSWPAFVPTAFENGILAAVL